MIKFDLVSTPLSQLSSESLVIFLPEDRITAEEKLLNKILDDKLSDLRKSGDFTGELNQIRMIYGGQHARTLLVGLGKGRELTLEKIRIAASAASATLRSLPIKSAAVILPSLPRVTAEKMTESLSLAFILANYEFPYYKAPTDKRHKLEQINLVLLNKSQARAARQGIHLARILGDAVTTTRDLGNHPSNIATPSHLAKHAQAIASRLPKTVKVNVLHKDQIKKEKMGAFLAVAQGSDEEPKFIVVEYHAKKNAPMVALVGKGLTFDAGGISIKPAERMEEMKYDMAGAAAVMGIIVAAAELNLPVNLVGLVPATENLPSGKAIKPGDIIRARSGKTIEVVNTDAEGRLILADALDYAKQYNPDLVIDFATLTGSIVVALGDDLIGTFTNSVKYLDKLKAAASTTGEKIWHMPLEKEYEQFIKSDFADLRNIGTVRYGDAINAANFLHQFVSYPWIHLDIAGVAWATREKPYRPKGATGSSVRLVTDFLKNFKK